MGVQSNTEEIRTDREPIEKRFPEFPQTEKLYWSATTIGDDTVGPTSLQLDIWAVLTIDDFTALTNTAVAADAGAVSPSFTPEGLDKKYDWQLMDSQYVFDSKPLGSIQFNAEIYFDENEHTLYIKAVGEG